MKGEEHRKQTRVLRQPRSSVARAECLHLRPLGHGMPVFFNVHLRRERGSLSRRLVQVHLRGCSVAHPVRHQGRQVQAVTLMVVHFVQVATARGHSKGYALPARSWSSEGRGWDGTAVLCCSFHPRLVQCPPPAGLGRLVQGPPPRLVQDPPQAAERGQLLGGSVQGPPPRSATAASGIRCAQALGGGPGRGGRLDVRLRGRFRVRTRYGPSFAQQVPAAVPVSAGRGTPRTALAPDWGRSAFIGSLRRVREKGS